MAKDTVNELMALKKKVKDLEEKKIASKTRLEEQRKQYDGHILKLKEHGIEDVTILSKTLDELGTKKEEVLNRIVARVEELEKRIKENV